MPKLTINNETKQIDLENTIKGIYADIMNIEKIETKQEENKTIKTVYFFGGGKAELEIVAKDKFSFNTTSVSMSLNDNNDEDDTVKILLHRTLTDGEK